MTRGTHQGTDHEIHLQRVGPWWRRRWAMAVTVNSTDHRSRRQAAEAVAELLADFARTEAEGRW